MTTNMAMTTNMKLNRDVPFPGGSVYFNAETGSITFPLLRIENQADGPVEISWPSAVSGKPQVVSIAPGRTTHLSIELNSGGVIRVRHTKTGGSGKAKITSLDRLVDDVDAQVGGQLYCNQTTQAVTLNPLRVENTGSSPVQISWSSAPGQNQTQIIPPGLEKAFSLNLKPTAVIDYQPVSDGDKCKLKFDSDVVLGAN
jgi:hypothetical protein